ncbi:TetR family transcriptional regulator [Longispora fulva]|uniref:AcrR family transcriptional regulator n=1 Tax=Longispora fulva TaxID=619741 RepID=A0A8J7GCH1_9ACTN|nr:TetR family transcriptional regulator [Longispora fulva]MBG6135086.1 AcrR family transcriptional regulator [Longispora fulva]GIG56679.1 TetR family transcriptional regulator [Longispora fulva]
MSLREMKKLRTRRSIQTEALRLFDLQGYEATTVDQIAAAAEVSPSTFFRYFATKEDVVVEDEYDPLIVEALRRRPAGEPPVDAIRAVLREVFVPIYAEDGERILARTRLSLSVPQLRARMWENLHQTQEMIVTALDADPADTRVLVGAVVGAWMAVIRTWTDTGEGDLPELLDDALVRLGRGFRE